MKNLILLVLVLSSLGIKAETWVLDKDHTKVGFSVPHLVISTVEGRFKEIDGSIEFDPKNPKEVKNFKIDVTIKADSIDTGNVKRDEHLRSKDFFDVKNQPVLKFLSKKVDYIADKKYKISGDLTMAGKTRPVTLDTTYIGEANAYEVKRVAFKAKTTVKREDFGLTWNDLMESGPVVGSEVEIDLIIQAKRKADLN